LELDGTQQKSIPTSTNIISILKTRSVIKNKNPDEVSCGEVQEGAGSILLLKVKAHKKFRGVNNFFENQKKSFDEMF
jgi:hypothetical protein